MDSGISETHHRIYLPFKNLPKVQIFHYHQQSMSSSCYACFPNLGISSVQFSCSVMSDSLWPHGLQQGRLPCPSQTPGACSNSCPLSQWCHPSMSTPVFPFSSCLQSCSFQWVSSSHQVAKVLEFQLLHLFFQWIFRTDFLFDWWFALLAVQGTLKSFLQYHSSKASILQCSAFFMV